MIFDKEIMIFKIKINAFSNYSYLHNSIILVKKYKQIK